MSDSDDDIFTKKSDKKYLSQVGLSDSDDDNGKKPETQDLTEYNNNVARISGEIKKWTAALGHAQKQGIDARRINKVEQKIKSLYDELESLKTHQTDREADRLEREIEQLELERLALDQTIMVKTERLRELRPYDSRKDWLNDPAQLGGHVVAGKFVETDAEDEQQQLLTMMAERRRIAQAAGQYNATSGHVKITNPTQINKNVGF